VRETRGPRKIPGVRNCGKKKIGGAPMKGPSTLGELKNGRRPVRGKKTRNKGAEKNKRVGNEKRAPCGEDISRTDA